MQIIVIWVTSGVPNTRARMCVCGQCRSYFPLITRVIIALKAAHVLRTRPRPAAFLHQTPNGNLSFTIRKHSAEYHYKLLYLYYTKR